MHRSLQEKEKSMIKKIKGQNSTQAWIFAKKTTSSDNSISSKNTEKIWHDKDEENIKVEEDGSSNDIFYLLDKSPSDNEKFECIPCHIPDNSFNNLAQQYKGSQRKSGFMD